MDVSRNEGGEAGVDPLNAVRNLQEDREKKAAEAERRLREIEEERMKVVPFKCCSYLQEDREKKAAEAERRLREMEEERMKLDEELKRHREKARRVNIGQEVLEAKIKVGRSMFFFSFF